MVLLHCRARHAPLAAITLVLAAAMRARHATPRVRCADKHLWPTVQVVAALGHGSQSQAAQAVVRPQRYPSFLLLVNIGATKRLCHFPASA
jgi:hypothetical protein